MTGHQVNSLVADLVEMAKAVERVPQLEQALHEVSAEVDDHVNKITSLTVQLEASRTYAAGLEQRCHDLEVARDDAELRFLQAEEHSNLALGRLRDMQTAMGQVITTLDPPKPDQGEPPHPVFDDASEPISVPTDGPGSGHTEGQSATDPTLATTPITSVDTIAIPSDDVPSSDMPSPTEGVSVLSNPTHVEGHTGSEVSVQAPAAVSSADANTSSPVTPDPEPTDKWSNDWWDWRDRQLKLRSATL